MELIEREAALTVIEQAAVWGQGYNAIHDDIRDIPSVDAAPVVHGKLESTGMDELYAESGRCTVCGGDNYIKAKFCNWCGARMDGGEEHEAG